MRADSDQYAAPLRLAFLGCGHIVTTHTRHLGQLTRTPGGPQIIWGFASRDGARAAAYARDHGGQRSYASYDAALADDSVDAVVVALPPKHHLKWTLKAIAAGKHVLIEKPALLTDDEYAQVQNARDASAGRDGRPVTVMVAENDHYKPLAVTLRRLLADGEIGELVLANFTTIADRPKQADDWRNDESMAGGDAFFEEGVHWLHIANSIGPRITRISGHRPARSTDSGPDRRFRSMLVAFDYDNGAVGALFYSREIPSFLRGARTSKLFGRDGVITFESNGAAVLVRGRNPRGRWSGPRLVHPGWRDIRGYQAMFADLARSVRTGVPPQMNLECAWNDHRLLVAAAESAAHGGAGAR